MIGFKVRMGLHGRVKWRDISLSEQSTLHDLAQRILETYDDLADDDFHPDDQTHLYGFWLKGEPWQKDALVYWHPEANEVPKANKTRLDALNFLLEQEFLFLFDFGAERLFVLKVSSLYNQKERKNGNSKNDRAYNKPTNTSNHSGDTYYYDLCHPPQVSPIIRRNEEIFSPFSLECPHLYDGTTNTFSIV